VDQHERRDVLLDPVLENLEVVARQLRVELPRLLVANDDVGGDEIDGDAEGRLPFTGRRGLLIRLRRGRRLRRRLLGGRLRAQRFGAQGGHRREQGRKGSRREQLSGMAHSGKYNNLAG
jgi:hypothetical protein